MIDQIRHSKSTAPILGMFLTLTAFAVSSSVIPPLITTITNEIAVNYTSFGLIIMLQFFSFFLAGTIGGWICESYGVNGRTFVLVGLLVVGLTLMIGSALTKLSWFVLWAIPLGFGGGLIETFGSILVSENEKPNSSKLLNLSQVFFGAGAISASPVVAALLYFKITWEVIFILAGIFILLILVAFFLLTRNMARTAAHSIETVKKYPTPLLKDSLFFFLAATVLIYVTLESVAACWVSVYFEKRLSCTVHASALRLSVFWTGLVFGRLAITVIPARFTLWPAMFIGIGIMFFGALLASFTQSPLLATVFVFLNGFGAGPVWPTAVAICRTARNRPKFTSAVIAIGAIGVTLGSGLGSIIFRYVDLSLFFPIMAFGCIMLLVLSFFSYRKYSKPATSGHCEVKNLVS
jgi:FHS family glucose/mannose:H+ symporter-like MFS transporter